MDDHVITFQNIEQNTLLIEIANRKVVCLSPEDDVGKAASVMAEKRISSIVITDEEMHPVGIVTERNMLRAMQSGYSADTRLQRVMSSPVITVPESMTCLDAYQICLRDGIRHLVIVDEHSCLLGVVSETDFRQHINLSALAGRRQVAAVMSRSVFSLPPDASLKNALDVMQTHRDTCVVVVESECPVGIVTERDVVRLYSSNPGRVDVPIKVVMTAPVLTIPLDSTINEAAEKMLSARVRHLVVVDRAGRVAGLVNEHDLTHSMALGLIDNKIIAEGAFLHALVDTIPDMVWLKDVHGVYQACNARFERFLGAKEKDIVGRTDADFPQKNLIEASCIHDVTTENNSHGPSVSEGWVTYADDGHREFLEILRTPMYDNQGEVTGVLSIARDITERKRMEQQLIAYRKLLEGQVAEESTKFRALVEQSLVGNYIIQGNQFCYVNSGFAEMFGYDSPEEIVGKVPVLRMVAPEDRALFVENARKRLAREADSDRSEFRALMKDGRSIVVGTHGRVIEFQGKPAIIGTLVDITEMRRSKEELEQLVAEKSSRLRQSEELLRTLLEAIPDAIQFKDAEGRWLETNAAARGAFGLDISTSAGKSDVELSEIVDAQYKAALLRCAETDGLAWEIGHASRVEEVMTLPNGERISFDVIKVPLYHPDGSRKGMVIVGRDVSELRRAQVEIAVREKELRTLTDNSPEVIVRYDRQCRRIFINPTHEKVTGKPATDLLGKSPVECWSLPTGPQGAHDFQSNLQRVLTSGQPHEWEIDWPAADGDILCSLVRAVPEFGPDGQVESVLILAGEITDRKRAEEALLNSLREYSELVQRIPVGVFKFRMHQSGDVSFDYVSPRWCEFLDISEEEAMRDAQASFARIHPEELQRFIELNQEARDTLQRFVWEGRLREKNGEVRWLHIESHPTLQENGDILWDGIQYDITDRRLAEEALRITASVFDNSQEAILITNAHNVIMDVNPAFSHITGYSREEVLGKNPKILNSGRQDKAYYAAMWASLKQNKAWRGEVWNRRKSGEIYAEQLSISVICDDDGGVQRYVGVFSDISHLKAYQAELSRVAHYDALTGIPNRVLLADRLSQAIIRAQRTGKSLAICYMDLDGFKRVNDLHGHAAGDMLLMDVTRRLQDELRADDTLARLGGDEFVVLFNDLTREEECFQVLERILDIVAMPVTIGLHEVAVSASMGVTFYPRNNEDGDTLLRHADQAMYIAKQTGKNRYHVYDSAHDKRVRTLHESRRRILQGLKNEEFELFYQPKTELVSGEVVGVEALIRWHHPESGLLMPAEFLPLIEESDLEIQLGEWVMDAALAQLDAWRKTGLGLGISINISARHLQSATFIPDLERRLARYPRFPQGRLQIEVLETAALGDVVQSSETIKACREMGISFALDDFGTGYSSLTYLRKLLADTLKIDQSFVSGMLTDEGDYAIVQGVIALAKTFGHKTVAEGIELPEHIRVLVEMGCMYGQGFGIAHPMPIDTFMQWYKERQ